MRACEICGDLFKPRMKNSKLCGGQACYAESRRLYYHQKKEREGWAPRASKLYDVKCPLCEKWWKSKIEVGSKRKYCPGCLKIVGRTVKHDGAVFGRGWHSY